MTGSTGDDTRDDTGNDTGSVTGSAPRERLLSPSYAATTIGMFALIAFVAFEAMAVTTVMPTVAQALDGESLYALTFAAPLACGVLGTVAAGRWSDRRGPALPLVVAMVLFSAGLLVCAAAPTMEVLLAGRVLQGLGGGALTVGLYVLVGIVFPPVLRPAVFASFAAAWVLPALFGPAVAALVADALGWRWVFGGAVVLVAAAALLITPALRSGHRPPTEAGTDAGTAPRGSLVWAAVAAVAVLALELLGSEPGTALPAVLALVLVVVSLRRLLPPGTLVGRRGLPSVIATRGLLSASFFCAEAYIVYVLQEQWGLSPGRAGIALTFVGITWAVASQAQARLGSRVSDVTAMRVGTALVLAGVTALALSVELHLPALVTGASYVLAGAGMGFGYPRTSVAMLAVSSDRDRGFNSSALTIADSLGAALALSVSGVVFAASERGGQDPFLAVFLLGGLIAALGVAAASRTRAA
ncbi:MFS transporter [Nocardioides terrigena]|uniref:MFS transporter n=1 Tax=Nocardioides terrigena TaxID=424797 RepID=UPI000D30FD48|nr:MFS transporter [Nocardioides terrigena]